MCDVIKLTCFRDLFYQLVGSVLRLSNLRKTLLAQTRFFATDYFSVRLLPLPGDMTTYALLFLCVMGEAVFLKIGIDYVFLSPIAMDEVGDSK